MEDLVETYLYVRRGEVAQRRGMTVSGALAISPGALNKGFQREAFQRKPTFRPCGRSEVFLANPILCQLSGLKRPSAICRWLQGQRIPYVVGADSWPRVLDVIIQERLGAGRNTNPVNEPQLKLRNGQN